MADPARYNIDPMLKEPKVNSDTDKVAVEADLYIERSPSGKWIKWHDFQDYKDAQRRNKTAEMNAKLGMEIAEMRSRLADLAAENERLRKASFVTAVPSEQYERLRKAGDELYKWAGAENRPPQKVYAAWNAAKEGRDAK